MLRNHLRTIKIFFTAFVSVWFVMIFFVTHNRVLEKQVTMLGRQSDYLKYKLEFDQGESGSRSLASAVSAVTHIFKNPKSVSTAFATSSGTAEAVPVLLYHGLLEKTDRFTTTPENFKNEMFALKRAGWETISVADFIAYIQGEKTLPEKSFLLTFDDGRVDSYREADPILKALGWSAVMFVATDQSLPAQGINEYYINEEQIKNMAASGRWEIESHARQITGGTFPIDAAGNQGQLLSNKMWLTNQNRFETDDEYRTRLSNELIMSKKALENVTHIPVHAFAYPFGDYGQESITAKGLAIPLIHDTLAEAPYDVAFRQTWDRTNLYTFNYPNIEPDLYRLRRVEPGSDWNGDYLVNFLNNAAPKIIPYTSELKKNEGWKSPWGLLSFDDEGLHLKTESDNTGGFAFLDGSRLWENYLYTVKGTRDPGGYLTLFARYQDDDNYIACTFGDKLVRIDEEVDGKLTYLAERKYTSAGPQYGIAVKDGTVSCLENGTTLLKDSLLDQKLRSGGVGVRIWDERTGQAAADLTFTQVSELSN